MTEEADAAGRRTQEALAAEGFADMRPAYRAVMRRLKERDADAFGAATRRYEEVLAPALADGEQDPVAAWTAYGAWLAQQLAPGRLVQIDETGLATAAEPDPEPGHVLLYLPDANRESAILILRPANPSPPQVATLELLTR